MTFENLKIKEKERVLNENPTEEILRKALADKNPKIRAIALKRLRELGLKWKEEIEKALSDPNPVVKAAAEKAYFEFFASQQLEEMLSSPEKEERLKAIEHIKSINTVYFNNLLKKLLFDESWYVREKALQVLKDRKCFSEKELMELKDHHLWYVRAAAVVLIWENLGEDGLSYIKQMIYDKNIEVRMKCIEVLENCGIDRARKILVLMKNDPNPILRNRVIKALRRR